MLVCIKAVPDGGPRGGATRKDLVKPVSGRGRRSAGRWRGELAAILQSSLQLAMFNFSTSSQGPGVFRRDCVMKCQKLRRIL